ncbi:LysR family transcriptional regulator [Paracoccus fistulariae]|uniref:LysR family transcriptional regulator n=1 Tax=Paracoccus fistulariae TaxID=658446 RepID=A0ABY7SMY3_9RHOB|nr:LysR family transcriptional regulator [Paracoccus fistulariae]MDB6180277.1 LysR family transcriptional regulator [Paracoccus fistulariae]WCR08360.1 LysR family transcriptional regulator [Paracoccus fistulariae]
MTQLSWDDLQFFLAVVRDRQLSRAARRLGTSHVTVSRRIDRLEQALGTRLFERHPRGYELTPAGQRLIDTAERMEEAAEDIPTHSNPGADAIKPFRLSAPEGFAKLFSTCILPELLARFPLTSPELITMPQVLSPSRRAADISVTLDPVSSGPYRSERMADYTLHLYATRDYLDSAPALTCREDLRNHCIIGYIEEMIFAPGLDYLGEIHPAIRASITSSSVFNQLSAVRGGLGIGVLPFYIANKYPELQIMLPDQITLTRTYWLTCHRDIRRMRRERTMIEFLIAQVQSHAPLLMHPAARKGMTQP